MSDYTPTTEEVIYAATRPHVDAYLSLPEFKRWLAAHDREVREQCVKPDRETIIGALDLYFDHDTNDIGEAVDAILAAWPGRTEAETREQVARDIEAAFKRHHRVRSYPVPREAYAEAARIARGEGQA